MVRKIVCLAAFLCGSCSSIVVAQTTTQNTSPVEKKQQPSPQMKGDVEILSDTMGVDFGPYLQRVLYRIKTNWYNLIPDVARPPLMKSGRLIIQFAIMKDGSVQGMTLQQSSGDQLLDRAAWGGIKASNPFDRLPLEFSGGYLALRIKFIYNNKQDGTQQEGTVPPSQK